MTEKTKKSWIRRYWLIEVVIAAVIGILITACWDYIVTPNEDSIDFTKKKPTLIGIYPSNAFGIDQKAGLIAGLKEYKSDFKVVHLDYLSLSSMKEGEIEPYLNQLRMLLKNENVFTIVGPSVTESSRKIVELLNEFENKPPIFLLTAASKRTLDWNSNRQTIPLYRICTDIDLRASKISGFIKKYVNKNKKVALLVEKNDSSNSYGNQFLKTIEESYGSSEFKQKINSEKIQIKSFLRSNLENTVFSYQTVFEENDLVLFLGVGNDFKYFIDQFYLQDKNPRAYFGAWLSSYAYQNDLYANKYNSSKIFEITDFDISAHNFVSPPSNVSHYKSLGRKVAPPERDFALGYDAAYIASISYRNISENQRKYLFFDSAAIEELTTEINRANGTEIWQGVTGEINFSSIGENQRDIQYVQYKDGKWSVITSLN